jgi:hypothetical protein
LDERKTDFLSEQLLAYWIEINDDLTDSFIFVERNQKVGKPGKQ